MIGFGFECGCGCGCECECGCECGCGCDLKELWYYQNLKKTEIHGQKLL